MTLSIEGTKNDPQVGQNIRDEVHRGPRCIDKSAVCAPSITLLLAYAGQTVVMTMVTSVSDLEINVPLTG